MRFAIYLQFRDKCEEALDRYREIFNGEELCRYIYDKNMTDDESLIGKVFHAELRIGEFYLYVSNTRKESDEDKSGFKIVYETESLEGANEIFDKLREGGVVHSEIQKMSFGPHIGAVTDCFGVKWNIVYC